MHWFLDRLQNANRLDGTTSFLAFRLPLLLSKFVCPTALPPTNDEVHNIIDTLIVLNNREYGRSTIPVTQISFSAVSRFYFIARNSPHPPSIPFHNLQIRTNSLSKINLINNQQITPCDSRSSLPRNFITSSYVNNVDYEVCQLTTVISREVVSSTFNE